MRTLFVFIITCLFFSKIFSQAPVFALPSSIFLIKGKPGFVKVKDGYLGVKQVEHSKKHQAFQTIKTTISVVNYDDKMVELGENIFSNGDVAYSLLKPQIVKGNKIWVICGDPGSGSTRNWGDQGNIRATEIDPQTYKPGASKVIVTAKELDVVSEYYSYQLKIISSPNSKYYCLYYGNNYGNEFFLACLDNDLEPVWKNRKKIPKTECDDINDLSINDNGEIIVTSVTKSGGTLSIYNINGTESHQKINFDNAEAGFIDILQTKSGDTYFGGTLIKNSKYENAVFLAKMEKDYTLSNMKQLELSNNILDRLTKDGLAKNDDKKNGLTGNHIQPELVEQGDGSFKLVIETTYEKSADYKGFGGLIITDFSKTENQFSLIPKFMVWFNHKPRINQFVAMPSLNSITVFYCDNAENINIDLKERQKTLNGPSIAALYAATIDNNGGIKREIIAHGSNKNEIKAAAQLIQSYIINKQK